MTPARGPGLARACPPTAANTLNASLDREFRNHYVISRMNTGIETTTNEVVKSVRSRNHGGRRTENVLAGQAIRPRDPIPRYNINSRLNPAIPSARHRRQTQFAATASRNLPFSESLLVSIRVPPRLRARRTNARLLASANTGDECGERDCHRHRSAEQPHMRSRRRNRRTCRFQGRSRPGVRVPPLTRLVLLERPPRHRDQPDATDSEDQRAREENSPPAHHALSSKRILASARSHHPRAASPYVE